MWEQGARSKQRRMNLFCTFEALLLGFYCEGKIVMCIRN